MTDIRKLVTVKPLEWRMDGPDVVVAGNYSITSDGYTYRLYFGEALLDTTRSEKGFSALYPSAHRHHQYRILAALQPTELATDILARMEADQ
jgi:hypothetical protein